ncbi:hypothetical protein MKY04_14110 [Lysinibacillus telephonicus]|uniref:hypothetical protein n=1 Tax=Lysinibacillus telephonicus TaxID=1714840 RepID=UPI0031FC1439
MKKKSFLMTGIAVAVILFAMIYWFEFSEPNPFPPTEQLLEEINNSYPEVTAKLIQDTSFVDERHVVVPFISNENMYGLSYWVWKNHEWQIAEIDTSGIPRLFKANKNNPSSYYFVWNIHPGDALGSIEFYFVRDRNFYVSDNIHTYSPKIQMMKEVSLKDKSYGVMQLPEEWVTIIEEFSKSQLANKPSPSFQHFFPDQSMYFGWIPYDEMKRESYPELSSNGGGFSTGDDVELEHVMIFNRVDVEYLK